MRLSSVSNLASSVRPAGPVIWVYATALELLGEHNFLFSQLFFLQTFRALQAFQSNLIPIIEFSVCKSQLSFIASQRKLSVLRGLPDHIRPLYAEIWSRPSKPRPTLSRPIIARQTPWRSRTSAKIAFDSKVLSNLFGADECKRRTFKRRSAFRSAATAADCVQAEITTDFRTYNALLQWP